MMIGLAARLFTPNRDMQVRSSLHVCCCDGRFKNRSQSPLLAQRIVSQVVVCVSLNAHHTAT